MGLKSTTVCLGYQQITSLSSATNLTVPAGASMAVIVVEGQGVRWRDDGTAPTSTVGMPLAVGSSMNYDGDMNKVQFIQQASGGILNISYYAQS